MPNVFLVEDDPITRESLIARITALGKLTVDVAVGSCAEIRAALVRRLPDVLLVDLGLPDGDGLDVIAEAAQLHSAPKIMVITVFGDEQRVLAAIKAGATGYLLKDDSSLEIASAIDQLLAGGAPISPAIARHLIRHFRADSQPSITGDHRDSNHDTDHQARHLSERERELLLLASKGFTYAEIANMLSITVNTVGSYTKRVYRKLAVTSRAEAVFEASRLGIIHPGTSDD